MTLSIPGLGQKSSPDFCLRSGQQGVKPMPDSLVQHIRQHECHYTDRGKRDNVMNK
jgi:hypothetical protein